MKVAPTAAILAAAGACAWPYVGTSTTTPPPAAANKAIPEISRALLKPTPPPKPERDPFLDPEVLRAEARERVVQSIKAFMASRFSAIPNGKVAATKKRVKPGAAKAHVEKDPRDGLVLNATSAQAGHGVAVINGRAYVTGERVWEAMTVEPCILTEVHHRHAVLLHRGKSLTLGYTSLALTNKPKSADDGAESAVAKASQDGPAPPRRSQGAPAGKRPTQRRNTAKK